MPQSWNSALYDDESESWAGKQGDWDAFPFLKNISNFVSQNIDLFAQRCAGI